MKYKKSSFARSDPILFSSGYSTDPVMANFKEYGFKGRIPKPFVMERIAETLGMVLAKRQ